METSPPSTCFAAARDSRRDWRFAAEESNAVVAPLSEATVSGNASANVPLAGLEPEFCETELIGDGEDAGAAKFSALASAVFWTGLVGAPAPVWRPS